jgi:hypothetical protein
MRVLELGNEPEVIGRCIGCWSSRGFSEIPFGDNSNNFYVLMSNKA